MKGRDADAVLSYMVMVFWCLCHGRERHACFLFAEALTSASLLLVEDFRPSSDTEIERRLSKSCW